MKIIFKDGKYTKISDDREADEKVRKLGFRYVSRSEWKQNVRDVKKNIVESLADKGKEAMIDVLSKHQKTKERRAKKHKKIYEKQIN